MNHFFISYLFFLISFVSVAETRIGVKAASSESIVQYFIAFPNGSVGSCTGVFITKKHILTAAHCLVGNPEAVYIAKRSYGIVKKYKYIIATNFAIHPDYNAIDLNLNENSTVNDRFLSFYMDAGSDLAIITLNKEQDLTPMELYKNEITEKLSLSVIGFPGNRQVADRFMNESSKEIDKLLIPVSNLGSCYAESLVLFDSLSFASQFSKIYTEKSFLSDCIASTGNSGGPVVTYVDGEAVLVGIISSGLNIHSIKEFYNGRNNAATFSVNPNGGNNIEWIKSILK